MKSRNYKRKYFHGFTTKCREIVQYHKFQQKRFAFFNGQKLMTWINILMAWMNIFITWMLEKESRVHLQHGQ